MSSLAAQILNSHTWISLLEREKKTKTKTIYCRSLMWEIKAQLSDYFIFLSKLACPSMTNMSHFVPLYLRKCVCDNRVTCKLYAYKHTINIEVLYDQEEFVDTKGVISIHKSKKNRQHNGEKK